MLVNLQNAWFDPSGVLRSPADNPHEFPDDYKDRLPSTAVKLTAKEEKEVKKADEETK